MKTWMQTELEFLCLGDKRRNDRFRKIVETAADHPTASVPQAQGRWYATKAAYQFWSSPKVDSMQLVGAMSRATAQRAADAPLALILHDTTNIGFSSSSADQLGYLDHGRGKGVLAHNTFVVSPQGGPSLEQAVRLIAMLGGFLKRKGDGFPGIKNVWRGMGRLQDLTGMWIAFEGGFSLKFSYSY